MNKVKVYVVVEVCPTEDGFDYNTWTFSNIDAARELIVKAYLDEYGTENDNPDEIMKHVIAHNGYAGYHLFENELFDKLEVFEHVQS